MHQWQNRVSHDLGLAVELNHVKFGRICLLRNDFSRPRRDHTKFALYFSQGNFSFGVAVYRRGVVKHRAHRGGTKHVFKD